jgi:RNA polymerase sigma-70 factor (ECF subfamily)
MRSELSAELAKLLAILTPTQREILVLRLMVGLSAEATAEATGSTAGAVRVAQHRALTRLRATLAARSSSGSRDTVRRAQPLTSRRPRS